MHLVTIFSQESYVSALKYFMLSFLIESFGFNQLCCVWLSSWGCWIY